MNPVPTTGAHQASRDLKLHVCARPNGNKSHTSRVLFPTDVRTSPAIRFHSKVGRVLRSRNYIENSLVTERNYRFQKHLVLFVHKTYLSLQIKIKSNLFVATKREIKRIFRVDATLSSFDRELRLFTARSHASMNAN